MKQLLHAVILVSSIAGSTLLAQQPADPRQPGPEGGAPQGGGRGRRAGPGPMMMGFGGGMFSPTLLLERREALNLTADQVTKLSTLESEAKAAREKAAADSKPHREELEKLWQQTVPDVTQLRTHAQALMQAEQGARLNALTTWAQAKAVLTPEQRGRVQGWADARRQRGRGFRGRRGPGMGGPGGGGESGARPFGGRNMRMM
jgi:Spy/CpxP family protein refolding chaperone